MTTFANNVLSSPAHGKDFWQRPSPPWLKILIFLAFTAMVIYVVSCAVDAYQFDLFDNGAGVAWPAQDSRGSP